MSDTLSTIKAFATAPTKLVILKDGNGGEHEFTMRRFVRQGDYDAVQKKFDGRDNFLKAKKGKLPIDKVAPELLEGLTDFFPDAELQTDGTYTFYLCSSEESKTATVLEMCVVDPQFTWQEACVLVRVMGLASYKLLTEWMKFNTLDTLVEAKND